MLTLNIITHSLHTNHTNSTSKITTRPQTTTPKTLTLQLWKRREHSNSRSRFKHTNNIRQSIRRRQLNKQMHMIRHHLNTNQTPIIRLTHLHQKTTYKILNRTNKHRMTILRTPNQMIPQT